MREFGIGPDELPRLVERGIDQSNDLGIKICGPGHGHINSSRQDFSFLYLTRKHGRPARKSMVRRQNIAALLHGYSEFTPVFHLRLPPGRSTSSCNDRWTLWRRENGSRAASSRRADLAAGPLAIGPFRR